MGGLLTRKGRVGQLAGRPTGAGYVTYESLQTGGLTLSQVLAAVPSGKIITFPEGTFEFANFTESGGYSGLDVPANVAGMWGSGHGTIFRMTPGSSTKASLVPTQSAGGTNELHLIDANRTHGFVFKNCQLQGTDQGHLYNGLRVGNGDVTPLNNVVVDGVFFNGCNPGDANAPPGETFAIDINHTNNMQILNCEFDGRHPVSRVPVCASPIGYNTSTNCYVADTYAHHSKTGMPTFWRCTDIHTVNLRSEYNGTATGLLDAVGVNHEQCGGTILHENITLIINRAGGNSSGFHTMIYSNDGRAPNGATVTFNGVTHDAGADQNGCMMVLIPGYTGTSTSTEYQRTLPTIIKNGVTLTPRLPDTDPRGYDNGNPNAEYFVYV